MQEKLMGKNKYVCNFKLVNDNTTIVFEPKEEVEFKRLYGAGELPVQPADVTRDNSNNLIATFQYGLQARTVANVLTAKGLREGK